MVVTSTMRVLLIASMPLLVQMYHCTCMFSTNLMACIMIVVCRIAYNMAMTLTIAGTAVNTFANTFTQVLSLDRTPALSPSITTTFVVDSGVYMTLVFTCVRVKGERGEG